MGVLVEERTLFCEIYFSLSIEILLSRIEIPPQYFLDNQYVNGYFLTLNTKY